MKAYSGYQYRRHNSAIASRDAPGSDAPAPLPPAAATKLHRVVANPTGAGDPTRFDAWICPRAHSIRRQCYAIARCRRNRIRATTSYLQHLTRTGITVIGEKREARDPTHPGSWARIGRARATAP